MQGFILSVYSRPAERLTATWEAASDLDHATERDFSDRIGVIRRGTDNEYFIESIAHSFSNDGAFHYITYTLSPAAVFGNVIILDTGPGLDVGILAR